jgi:hypothetical protein
VGRLDLPAQELSMKDPFNGVLRGVKASLPSVIEEPQVEVPGQGRGDRWMVTVFNNEHNTYDEVIEVLMLATNCTEHEAYIETWEIDHLGRSNVHFAGEPECRDVAAIIGQIGIRVEVAPEI